MAEYKDINDTLYERVIERLIDEGKIEFSDKLTPEQNNKIVDLINCDEDFEALYQDILEIFK